MPSLATLKLIAAGAAVLALLAGGFYSGYRWELGAYNGLVAAQAKALDSALQQALATQRKIDANNASAAMAEAVAQQKIVTVTKTITREVPKYVTVKQDAISCIPVGLARVLRAASAGVDPASLSGPAGQSDDACSDVTASEVAGWFTDYAGISLANAEQLNALEAAVRANDSVQ